MPLYDFACDSCGSVRSVLVDYATASSLELICTECGGIQTIQPVTAVNILHSSMGTANPASGSREAGNSAQRQGKGCGHVHHCRCAVKLTRPNPFQSEIRKAAGIVDEQ